MNFEKITIKSIDQIFNPPPELLEKLKTIYKSMDEPFFHIKQVGITSKLLSDWVKAGIIDKEEETDKKKWRQFSFFEAIWLRFVSELRKYGVTIEDILDFKQNFFPKNADAIIAVLNAMEKNSPQKYAESKSNLDVIKEVIAKNPDKINNDLKHKQFSVFNWYVIGVANFNLNYGYFSNEDICCFIPLSKPLFGNPEPAINEIFEMATKKSFVMINLRHIVNSFFENDKLDFSNEYFFKLMNDEEQQVINKIRSGLYKQIEVKLDDGVITSMRLSRKNNDTLIKQLSRQMKKGEYKQVEFIVRDGIVVRAEDTDIVKLKK